MKKYLVVALISLSSLCNAKDLGVVGHYFDIVEQDMLYYIKSKLETMQSNGILEQKNQEMRDKTIQYVNQPPAIEGIGIVQELKTWYYNPTLTVNKDIYDGDGKVFIKAGTTVNPLSYMPMNQTLIFINGNKPKQVEYAVNSKGNKKIILVDGRPFDLMKKIKTVVYFDQQGTLINRFGISNVPAIVEQDKMLLKVTEVPLND